MKILMLAQNDPAGMAIAFTHAINRYSEHTARLVTLETRYHCAFDYDIHLGNIRDDDFGEVEALLAEADVLHFHMLMDENCMLGPLCVRDYARGKKILHHEHGHPNFMCNHEDYRAKYKRLGRRVIVSTPDLLRQLPESTWVPNLVPIHDPAFQPRPGNHTGTGPVRVVQAPTRKFDKHTAEFRSVAKELAPRFPQAEFHVLEMMAYREVLAFKRRSHVVFDHMNGHFGISSLESLSQGVPVIAGLDDWNIAKIREFTGAAELPWVIARDRDALRDRTAELLASPAMRAEVGAAGRRFMEDRWTEQHALRVLLDVYESEGISCVA